MTNRGLTKHIHSNKQQYSQHEECGIEDSQASLSLIVTASFV